MMNAQDIKNGTCIRMDGQLYFVIEFLHVKPGKGNTFMRTKLKNVVDGRVLERRFNIGEKLEDVRVERRPYQYLYADGNDDIFMNNETFEQVPINKELVTGAAFMKEGERGGGGQRCFHRDGALCGDAYEDCAEDHLYRTRNQGRHRDQHAQARHGGDRR